MAELLCLENDVDTHERPEGQSPVSSYMDPSIFDNDQVMENLLRAEERYAVNSRLFTCVQGDLTPAMRKTVAQWMYEVCEEEQCRPEVYPLSMNCLDRFLSVMSIRKSQLQLTGTVCMLLASKFRQTKALSVERLCMYTEHSVTREEIMDWELLVISKLKWDLSAIIPNDFVDLLLHRLQLQRDFQSIRAIRSHTQIFITLCATEFEFSTSPPSMVAAAGIITAVSGLVKLTWNQKRELLQRLNEITSIEVDCLQDCQHRIEQLLARSCPELMGNSATASGASASGDYMAKVSSGTTNLETETPETPTDVQDVLF